MNEEISDFWGIYRSLGRGKSLELSRTISILLNLAFAYVSLNCIGLFVCLSFFLRNIYFFILLYLVDTITTDF